LISPSRGGSERVLGVVEMVKLSLLLTGGVLGNTVGLLEIGALVDVRLPHKEEEQEGEEEQEEEEDEEEFEDAGEVQKEEGEERDNEDDDGLLPVVLRSLSSTFRTTSVSLFVSVTVIKDNNKTKMRNK
jgi:hypothetical protein